MKALIFENKVVDLAEVEFEVHSSMVWVDCDDTVKHGYGYADGVFTSNESPEPTAEQKLAMLRGERTNRLAQTDYYALTDVPMSAEMTSYRQALRDITNTYTSLDDVVWPVKPE